MAGKWRERSESPVMGSVRFKNGANNSLALFSKKDGSLSVSMSLRGEVWAFDLLPHEAAEISYLIDKEETQ
jgi:hypothetical protein